MESGVWVCCVVRFVGLRSEQVWIRAALITFVCLRHCSWDPPRMSAILTSHSHSLYSKPHYRSRVQPLPTMTT